MYFAGFCKQTIAILETNFQQQVCLRKSFGWFVLVVLQVAIIFSTFRQLKCIDMFGFRVWYLKKEREKGFRTELQKLTEKYSCVF